MKNLLTLLLGSTTIAAGCVGHDPVSFPSPNGQVSVNGRVLGEAEVQQMTQIYGVRPLEGHWWYDPISGLYGAQGQPAVGFMYAGHDFGPLAEDASAGTSSTWINGRRLTEFELLQLASITGGMVLPGSFWLDSQGYIGAEGNPTPLANLVSLVQSQSASAGGGDNFWSSRFSAGNSNANNTQGYVSVPGYGPVGYGF